MTLHDRLKPVPDEDPPSGRGWNAVVLGVALAVLAAGFALAMPYAARPVTREIEPARRVRPSPDMSQPLMLPSPTSSAQTEAELDPDERGPKARRRRSSHQHRRADTRGGDRARRREPARSDDDDDHDGRAGDDHDPTDPPDPTNDSSAGGGSDDGDDGGDDDDHAEPDDDDHSEPGDDHGNGGGKGHEDEDSADDD